MTEVGITPDTENAAGQRRRTSRVYSPSRGLDHARAYAALHGHLALSADTHHDGFPLKGVAALTQYKARTGSVTVPRAHVEVLPDGSEVKLGVFLSNSRSRRAKLTADKLQAFAALGLKWAVMEGAA